MEHWASYFYLYGVGGILFFFAIYLGFAKKVICLSNSSDKKLVIGFIFSYLMYAAIHAFWNFQAIGALK